MKKENLNTQEDKMDMPLSVKNYKLLLIGVAMMILGFVLMVGGGSDDPEVFNTDMFSVRRIVIAPLILLAGLMFEIYAIMKK